jgi:hypothetical protein
MLRRSVKRKRTNKKLILVLVIGFVVMAVAGVGGYQLLQNKPNKSSNTQDQSAVTESQNKSNLTLNANASRTDQETPQATEITAKIDTLIQEDGYIKISGHVSASQEGVCVVQFETAADAPVIREQAAQPGAKTTQCPELRIQQENFSYLGDWKVSLKFYTKDGRTTKSEERVISIK